MVVIDSRKGPLRYRLVLFAREEELRVLLAQARPTDVIRVRHALCEPDTLPDVTLSAVRTACVDLESDADELLGRVQRRCREQLRQAQRLGARVRVSSDSETARSDFLELYNDFVSWKAFAPPLRPSRLDEYLSCSDVTVAYLDDRALAGHVVVKDQGLRRVRMLFSASARHREGDAARWSSFVNRLLHWQELLLYREAGYAVYDFGGLGHSSIDRFKLSFGGLVEPGSDALVTGSLARAPLSVMTFLRSASSSARGRVPALLSRRHSP